MLSAMKKTISYLQFCACIIWYNVLLAQPFSVVTYNIRCDSPEDRENTWQERRHWLAAQIRFHAPDIFGVQEAFKHQLDFLQEQLPAYAWLGVGRDDGCEAGEYAAIFYRKSRFQVEESGTFWLSPTPEIVSKGWTLHPPAYVLGLYSKTRSHGAASGCLTHISIISDAKLGDSRHHYF